MSTASLGYFARALNRLCKDQRAGKTVGNDGSWNWETARLSILESGWYDSLRLGSFWSTDVALQSDACVLKTAHSDSLPSSLIAKHGEQCVQSLLCELMSRASLLPEHTMLHHALHVIIIAFSYPCPAI